MFHFFVILGTTLVVVETWLLWLWIFYCFQRNISIVDIGWGVGFIAAVLVDFVLGEGFFWRKTLVLTIVSIWALRLVWHLAQRFLPDREDPRYQLLLHKWPYAQYPHWQALTLFAFQGLLITVLSIPFALMCQNALPFFSTLEVFGLLIWMAGVVGETVADYQLDQFKRKHVHLNEVYEAGLWKYSRHPNYFFEWVVWLAYCIMAFSAPFGWLAILAPLLMLYLLLKGSGIPLAEAQALQTKGEAYRDYQARTSAFFPWFSRSKNSR
jgi:steroid 5-alpha reductase family enzyme